MKIVARKLQRAEKTATPTVAALYDLAKQCLTDSPVFGVTARELKQKNPTSHDLIYYNRALAQAAKDLGAKASWTTVRPACDGTLQECRYRLREAPLEETP